MKHNHCKHDPTVEYMFPLIYCILLAIFCKQSIAKEFSYDSSFPSPFTIPDNLDHDSASQSNQHINRSNDSAQISVIGIAKDHSGSHKIALLLNKKSEIVTVIIGDNLPDIQATVDYIGDDYIKLRTHNKKYMTLKLE